MMERFGGRVAIVTGAASGIGRAITGRLLEERASVLAVDLPGGRLDQAGAHERFAPLGRDLTGDEAPARIVEAALGRFAAIDMLVNNAGRGGRSRILRGLDAAPAPTPPAGQRRPFVSAW